MFEGVADTGWVYSFFLVEGRSWYNMHFIVVVLLLAKLDNQKYNIYLKVRIASTPELTLAWPETITMAGTL